MFKFLLVAAFAALQLVSVPVALARPQVQVVDVTEEFEFACEVMQYDCSNIALPKVETAPLWQYGRLGQYDGHVLLIDNTVLPYFDQVYVRSVIAHELTHYIDHQIKGDAIWNDRCLAEWNAWRVGNAYVIIHGRPDYADYEWNVRYNCYL